MTTTFGSNLKKDNNLFIGPLLKGGRVSSKDILSRYKYSQARKIETVKEMYKNIEAARALGVSESDIRKKTMPLAPETQESLFIVPQVIE